MTPLREKFINHLQLKGFSDSTVRNYVSSVVCCAKFHNCSPLELSNSDIKKFLLHLRNERYLEAKTINLHLYSLKSFYNHFLPSSKIMEGLSRMKEPLKIPEILNKNEVEKIIDTATSLRTKALIAVLYSSGIRFKMTFYSSAVVMILSFVISERTRSVMQHTFFCYNIKRFYRSDF